MDNFFFTILSSKGLFILTNECLLQSYSAIFEAVIDGLAPNQARGRTLTFEVAGEGNLPRISINKPTVRNKRGQPLLLFKKNLVGRPESLPLILQNDGTLPSKVGIALFFLKAGPSFYPMQLNMDGLLFTIF